MPKVKVKRKSTFIDMTAMSDVTVLLLTFFMLTSVFINKEPVQVVTPKSVSEIKIPETNIMTILIEPGGKVFMNFDNQGERMQILKKVGENYNINFTNEELKKFSQLSSFGVPIAGMKEFLSLSTEQQDALLKTYGIPTDSVDNQFKHWVKCAREVSTDMKIAIKADAKTPYPTISDVMNSLRDLRENRYNLITSLQTGAEAVETGVKH